MLSRYDNKGKQFTKIVTKDEVNITLQTAVSLIEGFIHVSPNKRLLDALNEATGFIAITDGMICNLQGDEIRPFNFMALNKNHIICITENEDREIQDPPGGGL